MKFDIQRFLDLGSTMKDIRAGRGTYIRFRNKEQVRSFREQLEQYDSTINCNLLSIWRSSHRVIRYDKALNSICGGTTHSSQERFALGVIIDAEELYMLSSNTDDLLDFLDS